MYKVRVAPYQVWGKLVNYLKNWNGLTHSHAHSQHADLISVLCLGEEISQKMYLENESNSFRGEGAFLLLLLCDNNKQL
jgi:hypothetical protein